MSLEPVVVTGIGVISPLGHGFEQLMSALLAGESGVREVPELEKVGGLRSRLAATVEGLDPKLIPRNSVVPCRTCRSTLISPASRH